jgi:hypothetical protein
MTIPLPATPPGDDPAAAGTRYGRIAVENLRSAKYFGVYVDVRSELPAKIVEAKAYVTQFPQHEDGELVGRARYWSAVYAEIEAYLDARR